MKSKKSIKKAETKLPAKKPIDLAGTIHSIRKSKKLSGVDLCRLAGNLDPRTLDAVEKGRIKNPSLQTLQSITHGLGMTVSELFRQSETDATHCYVKGSQKGRCEVNFPQQGFKIVVFSALTKDFLFGKVVLEGKKIINNTFLKHPYPMFISPMVGHIEVSMDGNVLSLKEGENLSFSGSARYQISNLTHKDAVFLLVTAPSFV